MNLPRQKETKRSKMDEYIIERNKVISKQFYNGQEINDERKTFKSAVKSVVKT